MKAIMAIFASILCVASLGPGPAAMAQTGEGSAARGGAYVRAHCRLCHAVGRTGVSSYQPAPPFRTLHERYNVENLAEAFAEGVVVVHQGPRQMPEFVLTPDEIADLIAYLKTLEPRKPSTKKQAR